VWLVGEEGKGVQQILEMGMVTRLDCALGTSGLMRQALSQAVNHVSQRHAFGKALINQPLMRNVIADLTLESEAATALAMRLAKAFDDASNPTEQLMARVLTPIAKFWICKRGSGFAQEAMECMGGNGYVEASGEGVMARIYREMPLNSIWEGAGNIMAIDLLRALRKGDAVGALMAELGTVKGESPTLDHSVASLPDKVDTMADEVQARRLAQEVALTMQGALLIKSAPASVAHAFIESRIGGAWGYTYGTLGPQAAFASILNRAAVAA
jgi:putative acyl-CoA dehydrogenase